MPASLTNEIVPETRHERRQIEEALLCALTMDGGGRAGGSARGCSKISFVEPLHLDEPNAPLNRDPTFEALLKWHAVRPAEKHAALLEMLPLVRWDFILGERRAELLAGRHLAGMRAAADALAPVGGAGWRGLSAEEDAGSAPRFTGCSATESGVEGAGGAYRSLGCEAEVRAGSPSRTTAAAQSAAAAAELDTPSWAEVLAGVKQYLAPQPPAQQDEAAERQVCRPRQNTWGTLVGRNPEPPSQPQLTQEMQLTWLESTKEYVIMQRLESRIEYVIGRSRKSTIRIGHNAPMPYISSHHFRVYNEIVHADSSSGGSSGGDGGGGGGTASLQGSCPSSQDVSQSASQGAPGGGPRLEAWLEDLSQNGTFVNGKLVGRDAKRKLQDGDRIELVFPQESQPGSPNNVNHFPTFTYQAPSPWGDLSLASGVQRTNAAPSPGGAASQSSSQE